MSNKFWNDRERNRKPRKTHNRRRQPARTPGHDGRPMELLIRTVESSDPLVVMSAMGRKYAAVLAGYGMPGWAILEESAKQIDAAMADEDTYVLAGLAPCSPRQALTVVMRATKLDTNDPAMRELIRGAFLGGMRREIALRGL